MTASERQRAGSAVPARWLILADDLTGAADCAIPFARTGATVSVCLADTVVGMDADVLSFDAATRGLPAGVAAERDRRLLSALPLQGRGLFKKIDSTLRGQPAAEIGAMLTAMAGTPRAICAPAFPALKRVTLDGRVRVAGAPLESTETWRREHTYASADLVEMLATADIAARKVLLDVIRGDECALAAALAGDGVAVCDAVEDDDLDRIVAAGSAASAGCLWVGSAGLAYALARAQAKRPAVPLLLPSRQGGILIVVGTQAKQTREAAARLSATPGVRTVTVAPSALLAGASPAWMMAVQDIADGLAAGDVLLNLADGPLDRALPATIADRLGRLAATASGRIGGLAATGGETAAALLRHLGVAGIRLVDEVEAGVPLGLTAGALSAPIVTKAGAFGDGETLVRAVMRIREVRQKGAMP